MINFTQKRIAWKIISLFKIFSTDMIRSFTTTCKKNLPFILWRRVIVLGFYQCITKIMYSYRIYIYIIRNYRNINLLTHFFLNITYNLLIHLE